MQIRKLLLVVQDFVVFFCVFSKTHSFIFAKKNLKKNSFRLLNRAQKVLKNPKLRQQYGTQKRTPPPPLNCVVYTY